MNKTELNLSKPLISVIIPCRNEINYIGETITSLLEQTKINGECEIIVVDGMSDDGTRGILDEYSRTNARINVIENVKITTPYALNLGIAYARGQFICIIGAHSKFATDYFANCIELLSKNPDVSCVGGPIISEGKNNFSKAAALAMSSSIGIGNAKHRIPTYEGFAEMACFPMFRKEVFDNVGFYDESLIRNQDDEFFFRFRKSGEKVYLSHKLRSIYYVRNSPKDLFKQYYQYGFWRIAVLQKHKYPISFRQLVPSFFFFLIFFLIIISLISGNKLLGIILPSIYVFVLILYSLKILFKRNIFVAANFMLAVFILHSSYAAGFFAGLLNTLIRKK